MWPKVFLAVFFVLSLVTAFVLAPLPPLQQRSLANDRSGATQGGSRLRLMTWNLGNGDLESDSRAHTEDLPAVAKVINDNHPDAIALQELTGEKQLKQLLEYLQNGYRGFVCSAGSGDRVDAVLIRNNAAQFDREVDFDNIRAGNRFAAAVRFRLVSTLPEIVFVSAHADAFSASRRRVFAEKVVDWARSQPHGNIVFIAGDFNLEVSTRNKSNLFTDDEKHDSESYAYLLKYFGDLGLEAGATSINDRRIDYVFGDSAGVSLAHAEVLRDSAVGRMDHWPLLVEVEL